MIVPPASKEIRGDKLEVIVQSSKKQVGKKNSSSLRPILVLPTADIEVYANYSREHSAHVRIVGFVSVPWNSGDSAQNQHKHPVTTKMGPGTESADHATKEMSERSDHGKNLFRTIRIQLFAMSFILQVYDDWRGRRMCAH